VHHGVLFGEGYHYNEAQSQEGDNFFHNQETHGQHEAEWLVNANEIKHLVE